MFMLERKMYNSLDVAKFLAAILIIVLHTAPLSDYSNVLNFALRSTITVVAVPFFFITSGFLFFEKLNSLQEKEKNKYFLLYIKRLIVMYLLWSLVYFVFVLREWIENDVTVNEILHYIKRFFFEGSYSTIWFLPALISSVSIVYFLYKKIEYKKIFFIALPFYIIACLGSSYYGLSEKIPFLKNFFEVYFSFFDTIKNGLLFGFVFVVIGG